VTVGLQGFFVNEPGGRSPPSTSGRGVESLLDEHDHPPAGMDPGFFSPGGWFDPRAASSPSVTNLAFVCLPAPSFARVFSFLQRFAARALPESICGIQPCLGILCQRMSAFD